MALIVALALFALLPVRYAATAETFVSPGTQTATQSDPFAGSTFVLQRMASYSALATSPPVLSGALEATGADLSEADLASEVTALNPSGSVLLTVTVNDGDRRRAADLANAVAVQQAKAVEALESQQSTGSGSPIRLTPVTVAVVPPAKSMAARALRPGAAGVAAGLVVFAVAMALSRYRRSRGLQTGPVLTSVEGLTS